MINRAWLAPHYPPYWHYDTLQALLGLSRMGKATDPRAGDALDELERRRLPHGRWQAGGYWWKPPPSTTAAEVVDWGRSGPNQMITLNALRVLHAMPPAGLADEQLACRPCRRCLLAGLRHDRDQDIA